MLTDAQEEIVRQAVARKTGALSLPMGSGKTVISLVIALQLSPERPILVVAPKGLVSSWLTEIEKFFGSTIEYEVLHREYIPRPTTWQLRPTTRIVLTTTESLSRAYKDLNIDNHFVYRRENEWIGYTNVYHTPQQPLLSPELVTMGTGTVYAKRWGCLIVDEAHDVCNILVVKCRCIAALCAENRWLLSGTLFHEPKAHNLLGYYVLLNHPDNPGDIPSMMSMIRHPSFQGLRSTTVTGDTITSPPWKIVRHTVETALSPEESLIYTTCRDILRSVNVTMRRSGIRETRRRYAAYLLSLITYLRQILIAPIIPLASMALDAAVVSEGSELSKMVMKRLNTLQLVDWLESEAALRSTRCHAVINLLRQLVGKQVIVFSAFRTALNLLKHFVQQEGLEYTVFELLPGATIKKKDAVVKSFRQSSNGLLLLTYNLGGQGFNLQTCHTVLLLDALWSHGATEQAIARVARQGQTSSVVDVYTFLSNTAMEHTMYEKHIRKADMTNDLMDGPCTKRYHTMKVEDVIKIVLLEDNHDIYHKSLRSTSSCGTDQC